MPALTDNEARAVIYFAIGVSSEGADQAYNLGFAGNISHDAQGNTILVPVAASGYSIGTLQSDLGQSGGVVATQLTDAYQTWATIRHPNWVLDAAQRTQTIADLSRNGHQINDRDHGRDVDIAIKSRINTFLASDEGVTFVHDRDVLQVNKLMSHVVAAIHPSQLYQHASTEDQARLIAMSAKVFNQSEVVGQRIINGINQGTYHNVADINDAIDHLPPYVRSGRDHALTGADLFNTLQHVTTSNAMHVPWQDVLANPLVNPSQLGADTSHPHLSQTYPAMKDLFVDPIVGRQMVSALEVGGSYAHNAGGRGFYAEGHDFVEWGKSGQGRTFINGQWGEISSQNIRTVINDDHSLDLNIHRHDADERLLHVTNPRTVMHHRANPAHAAIDYVQHAGTLREHDHGSEVGNLQKQLAQLGMHDTHGRPLAPDGNFGPDTKAAVKEFQRSKNLGVDGIAGIETLNALKHAIQPDSAPILADPNHPGNAMYLQSLYAVHRLDAQHGRTPDLRSDNLAAALAVAAHANSMSQIDHVLLSDDTSRAFAIQGETASLFKRYADVDVAQAVGTPVAQSSDQWAQAIQQFAPTHNAPIQQPLVDQSMLQR